MKHFLGTFVFIALITLGSGMFSSVQCNAELNMFLFIFFMYQHKAHCFFGIRFLPRNNNFECEPGVYKFKV